MPAYLDQFSRDVAGGDPTRAYAQIHNSYTTAYLIETSYQALQEAFRFDPGPWRAVLPRAEEFMAAHEAALKGWRMFKMLCKAYETSKRLETRQLVTALSRVVDFEKTTEERRQP
jgi:hypothetical protein